jgi:hypothetical protein
MVRLRALRDRTGGSPDVVVGLIDGPVAVDHPDLANEYICFGPGQDDSADISMRGLKGYVGTGIQSNPKPSSVATSCR